MYGVTPILARLFPHHPALSRRKQSPRLPGAPNCGNWGFAGVWASKGGF